MADNRQVHFNLVWDEEDEREHLTVVVKGKGQFPATSDHPNYEAILDAARAGDPNVIDLFDVAHTAGTKFARLTERVTASNGVVYLDGVPMHNALTAQIADFIGQNEDVSTLVNFYDKLVTNPNQESVEHLYKFIEANQDNESGAFTITPEGKFIAYKGVRSDGNGGYESTTAGEAIVDDVLIQGYIPNKVGSVVEMRRDQVVFDPSNHCSSGLHVGTFSYAKSFGRNGAMLKVLIDPRDVVSVPNDSKEKMRVCRYEVLEIVDTPNDALIEDVSADAPEYDVRVGDVFEDTDSRRKGSKKKVVAIDLDNGTATVESKNKLNITRKREIALSRLFSRKYNRVKRGRKS
jgi:hypothetical protein